MAAGLDYAAHGDFGWYTNCYPSLQITEAQLWMKISAYLVFIVPLALYLAVLFSNLTLVFCRCANQAVKFELS